MKLKTIFLALLWLTTLAAHAATDGQGKMEAMRGKVQLQLLDIHSRGV